MREWIITLGKKVVNLSDVEETADPIEMCTRAVDYQLKIRENFAVSHLIEAYSEGKSVFCNSEIVLANASLHKQAHIMNEAVKKYLASKIQKPKKVKE